MLPHRSGGIFRYLIAVFLSAWLCGWAFGWITAFTVILSGDGPADAFLIFWLCGWTVGGIFAAYFLYIIVRPAVPETLEFSGSTINYDSGVAPFHLSFDFYSRWNMWKRIFRKRIKTEFNRTDIKTLKLREFGSGNRLTIDNKNNRIDIGTGISELEREWLFDYIRARYEF